jgi:hypothetical protein
VRWGRGGQRRWDGIVRSQRETREGGEGAVLLTLTLSNASPQSAKRHRRPGCHELPRIVCCGPCSALASMKHPRNISALGDTAFILIYTFLVLMMTIPCLFYGSLSQAPKVLETAMHSFSITCLITVLWLIFGFSGPPPTSRSQRAHARGLR